MFSQTFTSGATSSSCPTWQAFQALLTVQNYTSLTMSGSNNLVGITLTDPVIVATIALALRTNTAYGPVISGGYSWSVGSCGSGFELTATGTPCTCGGSYTVRPCVGNLNWGGINTATCGAGTQSMTVRFQ